MPTGVSNLYYPKQSSPALNLALDDSYFLVRLYEAQALFEAGWLVKPGALVLSSSVESSFQPGSPTESLYQIAAIQKNIPYRLGININLTDWLPARSMDSLKITFKYTVVQDKPFNELADQMGKIGLAAKVSLVRADLAVAVKVSEIAGRLLGYLLREGSKHEVLSMTMDLPLASLQAGYHAVLGTQRDQSWPATLSIDANKRLTDSVGIPLQNFSYAVIEVLALKRSGNESIRGEPWWELLQTTKEKALDASFADEQEQRKAFNDWRSTLTQVRALARKEKACLLKEVQEIIQEAQVEVEGKLAPKTKGESAGFEELPEDLQDVLGVNTVEELQQSVSNYKDALLLSRQLLERYESARS
jgi:hypothetical protein